jgi:hypothetical protein
VALCKSCEVLSCDFLDWAGVHYAEGQVTFENQVAEPLTRVSVIVVVVGEGVQVKSIARRRAVKMNLKYHCHSHTHAVP